MPWQMPDLVAPETQVRGPGEPAAFAVDPDDPEAWRAQIFRSIDSDSAAGMPSGSDASILGLDSGKGMKQSQGRAGPECGHHSNEGSAAVAQGLSDEGCCYCYVVPAGFQRMPGGCDSPASQHE